MLNICSVKYNPKNMLAKYIDTVIPYVQRNKFFKDSFINAIEGIRFMEMSNCWIRYTVRGKGKHTLVIAPDSPVTIEAYTDILETLAQKYRVVIFETPAFGFSIPKLHFDFSYETYTETIAKFLQKLDLGPYILAIPCVAGLSAIGVANRYPQMVKALISTQTPCWSDQRNWVRGWDKMGIMTVPFWSQFMGHYLKTRKVYMIHRVISNQRQERLEALSKMTLSHGACNSLATACQYYLKKKEPELLRPIKQPSISIWGTADWSHDRTGTEKTSILKYLPNSELVYFEEAGHFLEVEAPLRFMETIDAFIDASL